MPTMSNPDCTQCDTTASTVARDVVGTFEGADYFHCGAFLPEYDCKMRTWRTVPP
jgi:IgA Peptidase M64